MSCVFPPHLDNVIKKEKKNVTFLVKDRKENIQWSFVEAENSLLRSCVVEREFSLVDLSQSSRRI